MEDTQRKSISILIKVLIAIGSALLGVLGGAQAENIMSMM
jgi:hypothetical protein